MWSVGVGIEWQWRPNRSVFANLNYIEIGDGSVTTPNLAMIGAARGHYSHRRVVFLQIGIDLGPGVRENHAGH